MNEIQHSRKTNLFIILGSIFLTNAILAEIIGVKIFSAEKTLGFEPVNWTFFGEYVLDFNLTAGAVIWPIVFITTDIINEYFGKKGVRKISFITAGLITYVFLIISLVTVLVPADFWLDVNSQMPDGSSFNIDKLKTQFDGIVHSLEYNGYTYRNLIANRTIQRKAFNGELEIEDENIGFTSNVEVDFSKKEPLFNIVGDLSKADLHSLKLIKDSIKIAGLLDVNFTGSNIDQFIGTAKLLNANIQNASNSIQFDSLNLSSYYSDSIKTLHVGSNEFNATINGQFNIKELPSSFQAFLHNYYPALGIPNKPTSANTFNSSFNLRRSPGLLLVFWRGARLVLLLK